MSRPSATKPCAVRKSRCRCSKALRTCGNGGLFSFTGFYWSKRLGPFRAYVTNHRHCVVLRLAGKTVVMSPDDPEAFMRALLR